MSIERDRRLRWINYVPMADEVPLNIQHLVYTCTNYNNTSCDWNIEPPSTNALMDTEIYVKYTIRFTGTSGAASSVAGQSFRKRFESATGDSNVEATGTQNLQTSANVGTYVFAQPPFEYMKPLYLRQGWSVTRAMTNCTVRINGTSINCSPYNWLDQFERIYMSKEDMDTVGTLSGGYFDDGDLQPYPSDMVYPRGAVPSHTTSNAIPWGAYIESHTGIGPSSITANGTLDAPSGAADINNIYQTVTLLPQQPITPDFLNSGATKRWHNMVKYARSYTTYDQGSGFRYANEIFYEVWERIPLSPFLLFENRDAKQSIPNIKQLSINFQFSSIYQKLIVQSLDEQDGSNPVTIELNPSNKPPELYIQWVIPKHTFPIPAQVSIPFSRIQENTINITSSAASTTFGLSAAQQGTFNNIRLEQWPDLLLFYIRPQVGSSSAYADPSDFLMEITDLQITTDGQNSKLMNCKQPQLYNMFLKNSVHDGREKLSFLQWKNRCCLIPIRPRDVGLTFGPGYDNPLTVNFTFSFKDNQAFPVYAGLNTGSPGPLQANDVAGRVLTVFVICQYERYSLTLNANGGSKMEMLKVPLSSSNMISNTISGSAALLNALS